MKVFKILFFFVIALTGCAPIPHYINKSPDIDGIIFDNRIPLVGEKLKLSVSCYGCSDEVLSLKTDEQGKFKFFSSKKFQWYMKLMQHHASDIELVYIRSNGKEIPIYSQHIYDLRGAVYPLSLVCDISKNVYKNYKCFDFEYASFLGLSDVHLNGKDMEFTAKVIYPAFDGGKPAILKYFELNAYKPDEAGFNTMYKLNPIWHIKKQEITSDETTAIEYGVLPKNWEFIVKAKKLIPDVRYTLTVGYISEFSENEIREREYTFKFDKKTGILVEVPLYFGE